MESGQKVNLRKGRWEEDEDELLKAIVLKMGEGRWDLLAQTPGLLRSGKSCRMRWLNYLKPNLKKGKISREEEAVIIQLHEQWGNKWSKIAKQLPGRTDNDIKNYWRIRDRKQQSDIRNSALYANMSMIGGHELSNAEPDGHASSTNINQELSFVVLDDICAPTVGFPDFGIPNSPYETRLSHWMPDFSENQREITSNNQLEAGFDFNFDDDESFDVHQESVYQLWDP